MESRERKSSVGGKPVRYKGERVGAKVNTIFTTMIGISDFVVNGKINTALLNRQRLYY